METPHGKRALVTGAASGIGRATDLALAREGAELFLVDIDEPGIRASARDAEALGATVRWQICDISNPAAITAYTAACVATFRGLDILVNCAGTLRYGHVNEMSAETWNAVISVNLLAPIQFTLELLPSLAAQGGGHILNVCSLLGLVPGRSNGSVAVGSG